MGKGSGRRPSNISDEELEKAKHYIDMLIELEGKK